MAIFELFRQSMPEYPVNALDADKNTGELSGFIFVTGKDMRTSVHLKRRLTLTVRYFC